VDTQVDFLSRNSRLYVRGAEKIIPTLQKLTQWADEKQIALISSACAHRAGDPELDTYGPHCMAGTPGQQKIAETLLARRLVVPNRPIDLPDLRSFQQIVIEKQEFDAFSNPNAEAIVRQFGSELSFVLYGVTTDVCVTVAANALLERGHHVSLVSDAVAALDKSKASSFLTSFLQRGGSLVHSEDIFQDRRVRDEPGFFGDTRPA
jgi:nicotinamidase/pyrazinamidase